ncbi:MAG: prepilin-type N-terminal cleavage/methylation domain-containing protein [Candidatus Marinimicrobia bacterium]|nr:prepilin-type N-terminal cleavage/methylation domain-containing protein [Candidatus Neomarinimicrobiota bacterium]MCF7904818.1 prepilin-type N-terminal cleavage/methylation domain-containing protein [Candidatus Neomarinimicrobiota bacterium]
MQAISKSRNEAGFTLVELTTAMLVSAILILSFSTVILFTRKELTNTAARVGLGQDQVLMDRYIRTKLTATISDSMKIYTNSYAESVDSTSTSGVILKAVSADSTVYHISASAGQLVWMEDSIAHEPVDGTISSLNFTERTISSGKNLSIMMEICSASDTLKTEWSITLRN